LLYPAFYNIAPLPMHSGAISMTTLPPHLTLSSLPWQFLPAARQGRRYSPGRTTCFRSCASQCLSLSCPPFFSPTFFFLSVLIMFIILHLVNVDQYTQHILHIFFFLPGRFSAVLSATSLCSFSHPLRLVPLIFSSHYIKPTRSLLCCTLPLCSIVCK